MTIETGLERKLNADYTRNMQRKSFQDQQMLAASEASNRSGRKQGSLTVKLTKHASQKFLVEGNTAGVGSSIGQASQMISSTEKISAPEVTSYENGGLKDSESYNTLALSIYKRNTPIKQKLILEQRSPDTTTIFRPQKFFESST